MHFRGLGGFRIPHKLSGHTASWCGQVTTRHLAQDQLPVQKCGPLVQLFEYPCYRLIHNGPYQLSGQVQNKKLHEVFKIEQ